MKSIGKLTFGKSRPAPKLACIKKDPEAVIEYIIVKALKAWAKK
jgi:hypothetical protein